MVVVEPEPGVGKRMAVDVRGPSELEDSESPPREGRSANSIVESNRAFCSVSSSPR